MSESDRTINLSRTPARPSATEIDEAMVFVSETLGQRWIATRLGAQYVFQRKDGPGYHLSRRRDFRQAVADATGLTVIR